MTMNNVVQLHAPSGADPSSCEDKEYRLHGDWPREAKDRGRTVSDPLTYVGVCRQLSRIWRSHLSHPEYSLLHFILDMTIGWQKTYARFTYRRLTEGTAWACGTGLSETQARLHLNSLEAKGFISVDRSEPFRGLEITPNIDLVPVARAVPAEAKPVRVRHRTRPAASVAHLAPPAGEIERTLCRAFELSDLAYDDAYNQRVIWSYDRRMALARQIVTLWSKEDARNWPDSTPDICQEFADWLVAAWPQIAQRMGPGTPKWPDVRFVYTNRQWLLSEFRSSRQRRSRPLTPTETRGVSP